MYIGDEKVVDARPDPEGVDIHPLSDWYWPEATWVEVLRVKTDPEIREEAVRFALSRRNQTYDLWSTLLDFKQRGGDCGLCEKWYCSELVWAAYRNVGNIDLDSDTCPFILCGLAVSPTEIALSSNVKMIGEHKEERTETVWTGSFFGVAYSPVDLTIIDPAGLILNKLGSEIPEAVYEEIDIDEDGELNDLFAIFEPKIGNYQIQVIPEPGALPEDTYTLEVGYSSETYYDKMVLAEDVPISDIPEEPYVFGYSTPPEITSFAPPSPVNDTVCNWRTFNVTVNQRVNVSWYLNGTLQATNVSVLEAKCTLHAEVVGEHNVTAIASNTNGTDMQTWIWNVTKAVGNPDLIITEKWLCWPDNCTICYNVTNTGDGTAPACHNTTLYVDGVEVAHDHVPVDLAPGESYTGCFNDYVWAYTPPSDEIRMCADNNESLDELDEDNNCLTNLWMCGDLNGDGKVTMSDVRKVFNRYLDPNYPLDLPWAADVNCDGKVTMSDVRKVFNRYLDPGYDMNCCCK